MLAKFTFKLAAVRHKTLPALALVSSAVFVVACGGDNSTSGSQANSVTDNLPADLNVISSLEDFTGGNTVTDGQQAGADPLSSERVALIVESENRCAGIFEPLEIVISRQQLSGEDPDSELPSVNAIARFAQGFGTSLNLVSRTDDAVNFEVGKQDILSLTAFIDNGSITTFVAGYDVENPESFIMRKPVDGGCLYAFKSEDFCTTGLSTVGVFASSRNGASMSALGCALENPNELPVIDLPAE